MSPRPRPVATPALLRAPVHGCCSSTASCGHTLIQLWEAMPGLLQAVLCSRRSTGHGVPTLTPAACMQAVGVPGQPRRHPASGHAAGRQPLCGGAAAGRHGGDQGQRDTGGMGGAAASPPRCGGTAAVAGVGPSGGRRAGTLPFGGFLATPPHPALGRRGPSSAGGLRGSQPRTATPRATGGQAPLAAAPTPAGKHRGCLL